MLTMVRNSGEGRTLIFFKLRDSLTRPIGLSPHTSVAQKIADQRCLIADSAKKVPLKNDVIKGWLV